MKKLILISLLVIPFCKAADDYYLEAQHAAAEKQWQDLYKLIDEGKVGVNEIQQNYRPFINFAIMGNHLETTRELLDKGADPNLIARVTPLQRASNRYLLRRDNRLLIELLLKAGADPYATNSSGETTFEFISNHVSQFGSEARAQELINWFEQSAIGTHIKGADD